MVICLLDYLLMDAITLFVQVNLKDTVGNSVILKKVFRHFAINARRLRKNHDLALSYQFIYILR